MSHHPQAQPATTRMNGKNAIRACESCRTRKMRCIQDVSSSSEKCQRCERRNIDCLFTERSTKRRRKRTDTRVAELEKEVKAMSTALRQGQNFSAQRDTGDDIEYLDVNEDDKQAGKRSTLTTTLRTQEPLHSYLEEAALVLKPERSQIWGTLHSLESLKHAATPRTTAQSPLNLS